MDSKSIPSSCHVVVFCNVMYMCFVAMRYPDRKKGEIHRWKIAFPKKKDFITSVMGHEEVLAQALLDFIRLRGNKVFILGLPWRPWDVNDWAFFWQWILLLIAIIAIIQLLSSVCSPNLDTGSPPSAIQWRWSGCARRNWKNFETEMPVLQMFLGLFWASIGFTSDLAMVQKLVEPPKWTCQCQIGIPYFDTHRFQPWFQTESGSHHLKTNLNVMAPFHLSGSSWHRGWSSKRPTQWILVCTSFSGFPKISTVNIFQWKKRFNEQARPWSSKMIPVDNLFCETCDL